MDPSTDADEAPTETQQDRCSQQRHRWRRGHPTDSEIMWCPSCGAVHPNDLDRFLASTGAPS